MPLSWIIITSQAAPRGSSTNKDSPADCRVWDLYCGRCCFRCFGSKLFGALYARTNTLNTSVCKTLWLLQSWNVAYYTMVRVGPVAPNTFCLPLFAHCLHMAFRRSHMRACGPQIKESSPHTDLKGIGGSVFDFLKKWLFLLPEFI